MEEGLGFLWRITQFWNGCLRAAGLLVLPSTLLRTESPGLGKPALLA